MNEMKIMSLHHFQGRNVGEYQHDPRRASYFC